MQLESLVSSQEARFALFFALQKLELLSIICSSIYIHSMKNSKREKLASLALRKSRSEVVIRKAEGYDQVKIKKVMTESITGY